MPPVGGFVALCAQGGRAPEPQKRTVHGDFFKIEFIPNTNSFKGKLIIMFSSYRICHEGVKVCLKGNLTLTSRVNILQHCPTETILLPGIIAKINEKFTHILYSGAPYCTKFQF